MARIDRMAASTPVNAHGIQGDLGQFATNWFRSCLSASPSG